MSTDKIAALRTLQNAQRRLLYDTKDAECQTDDFEFRTNGYDILEEVMSDPALINELLKNIHQRINITYVSTPPRGKKVAIKQPREQLFYTNTPTESAHTSPSKRSRLTEDHSPSKRSRLTEDFEEEKLLSSPLLSVDSEQFHVIMDDTQMRKPGRPLPAETKE